MAVFISPFADVDRQAQLGCDVHIGPFCVVGPHVELGDECRLESHVTIAGRTSIGKRNRFCPQAVIGTAPQDVSWRDNAETWLEIGDDNQFREGVTVNIGAMKEDHTTRIGHRNLLMTNSHVAHNCFIFNDTILVNGVLLGGHVHVHDGAIVSGNSVVHHYSTLGRLSFVSGGCRVPHDIPPFMLAAGSDNPTIKTINIVGMRRAGISAEAIKQVKRVHRLFYREHKALGLVQQTIEESGVLYPEVESLFEFLEQQRLGKMGRGREGQRTDNAKPDAAAKQAKPDDDYSSDSTRRAA